MSVHDEILRLAFGSEAEAGSYEQVGLFLVRLGWIYTFTVSLIQTWGMAAPYGKHLNDNVVGAKIWNRKFRPKLQTYVA